MKQKIYMFARRIVPKRALQTAVRVYERVHNSLKYGDPHFFREVSLEINAECNRRCYYCPQNVHPLDAALMSEAIFEKALERLKEIRWGGPIGYAHFNEPLLRKDIVRLVRRTKEVLPHSLPRLYTNGDFLTETLTAELVEAGLVNFAVTRHDLTERRWKEHIVPIAEKFPQHFSLEVIHGKALSNRGGLVTNPKVLIGKMTDCANPEAALHISHKGNVLLCCCDYFGQNIQGNIMEESLKTIWKHYADERKSLREGQPIRPICKACFGQKTEGHVLPARPSPVLLGQNDPSRG